MPEDYPANIVEFEERFATEQACRSYLLQVRWPDGFRCPRCSHGGCWPRRQGGLLECARCGYKASPTAGTILDRTRIPLRLWFRAMWLVTNQKNGIAALSLQRQLGLSRYETVWTMLHKLRRAMVRPGRERLSGTVEVDESYVGGEELGVAGRGSLTKSLVAIAAEEDGNGIGRIRLCGVADASEASLLPFIEDSVSPGSVIRTDGWKGYGEALRTKGYRHEPINVRRSGKQAHQVLPRVHRVAGLLQRWWLGTHHGAIGPLHLDYYLDEFTFRFNRRSSLSRGKLFYRLVQQVASVEPVHWSDIADGERHHNRLGSPQSTG